MVHLFNDAEFMGNPFVDQSLNDSTPMVAMGYGVDGNGEPYLIGRKRVDGKWVFKLCHLENVEMS